MALPNGDRAEAQGSMRLLRVELSFCRVWEIHKSCSAPISDALHFAVPLEEALLASFLAGDFQLLCQKHCIETLRVKPELQDGFGCGSAFALSLGISPCTLVIGPARWQ